MSSGMSAFRFLGRVIDCLADTLRRVLAGRSARRASPRSSGYRRRRLPTSLGLTPRPRPAIAELALLIHQLPPGPASAPLRELWRALATHGGSLDALPSASLQVALESLRAPALAAERSPGLQQLDELLQLELLVRGRRRLDSTPPRMRERAPR